MSVKCKGCLVQCTITFKIKPKDIDITTAKCWLSCNNVVRWGE